MIPRIQVQHVRDRVKKMCHELGQAPQGGAQSFLGEFSVAASHFRGWMDTFHSVGITWYNNNRYGLTIIHTAPMTWNVLFIPTIELVMTGDGILLFYPHYSLLKNCLLLIWGICWDQLRIDLFGDLF